uniref:Microfibril associated protein 2 n=1 Tax=Ornithorhynchus anatinus TaxID=9258 RepID=A0A6I8PJV7_ORNAN
MRTAYLFLLCLPAGLLAQGQYDIEPPPYPDQGQYSQYNDHIENPDYYDYQEVTRQPPEEQFQYQSQQQVQQEVIQPPTPENPETEPTEPGPLDCREEQYPCTRLYSVHKPCKQCLNQICFYSLRRIYVINKEICVRTVCAHEELLRGKGSPNPRPHSGPTVGAPACREVGGGCPCVGPFPMFTVLGPPPPRPPAPH